MNPYKVQYFNEKRTRIQYNKYSKLDGVYEMISR